MSVLKPGNHQLLILRGGIPSLCTQSLLRCMKRTLSKRGMRYEMKPCDVSKRVGAGHFLSLKLIFTV